MERAFLVQHEHSDTQDLRDQVLQHLTSLPRRKFFAPGNLRQARQTGGAALALVLSSCSMPGDAWIPAPGSTDLEPPRALLQAITRACRESRHLLPRKIGDYEKVSGDRFADAFAKLRRPAGTVSGGLSYGMRGHWNGHEIGQLNGSHFEAEGAPIYVVSGNDICQFRGRGQYLSAAIYMKGDSYRLFMWFLRGKKLEMMNI